MRIYVFYSIILFSVTITGIAQEDTLPKISKIKYGVNIGAVSSHEVVSRGTYAHFTMEKGQIFFSIGPTFGNKKDLGAAYHDYYYKPNSYSLNGIRAVYQVSPNPARKVFQSYIHNELFFHYYSDKGKTQEVFTDVIQHTWLTSATSYNHQQTIVGNYLGWGFKLKLPYHFYINNAIALGISHFTTTQTYGISSYNSHFSYYNYDVLLKIGVGHTFDYKLQPIKLKRQAKEKPDLDSLITADIISMDVPQNKLFDRKPKEPKPVRVKQPKPHYKNDTLPNKAVWGINVGAYSNFSDVFPTYVNVTLEKGKNAFELGLITSNISFAYSYGLPVSNKYGLTGANFVYQRFPKQYNKRNKFYFQNMLAATCVSYSGIQKIYNYYPAYYLSQYKAEETTVINYLSYGCKVNFLKNFYLDQCIGFGIGYVSASVNYDSVYPNQSNKGAAATFLFKLGIGYRFNKE